MSYDKEIDLKNNISSNTGTTSGTKSDINKDNINFYYFDSLHSEFRINIYVLCDGHGEHGKYCSSYVSKETPIIFQKMFNLNKGKDFDKITEQTIRELNEKISVDRKFQDSGTTLCMIVHCEADIYSIYIGNTQAFLFTNNKRNMYPLTLPHSIPNNDFELIRLCGHGDFKVCEKSTKTKVRSIEDTNGHQYISTRSIGNLSSNIMTSKFDIVRYRIGCGDKNLYLFICSDGVTNFVTVNEIHECILQSNNDDISENIIKLSLEKGSDDSITTIFVDINNNTCIAKKNVTINSI